MSGVTKALADLKTKLGVIAPVRTGRAALETSSAALPVIVVWSTQDQPTGESGFNSIGYTRTVVIEIKVDAAGEFTDTLDTALSAFRAAIQSVIPGQASLSGAVAVRETGARFYVPESGSGTAISQITLEIDYIEPFRSLS
ncbi:MAG TPA: hypothetical protein PKL33_14370 [Accumulibacter sp.]|nr:hypothetical protein [Accumulibacter sp.]